VIELFRRSSFDVAQRVRVHSNKRFLPPMRWRPLARASRMRLLQSLPPVHPALVAFHCMLDLRACVLGTIVSCDCGTLLSGESRHVSTHPRSCDGGRDYRAEGCRHGGGLCVEVTSARSPDLPPKRRAMPYTAPAPAHAPVFRRRGAAPVSASRAGPSHVAAAAAGKTAFKLTLLPGDGIGPEIMRVAVDCLNVVVRPHPPPPVSNQAARVLVVL
jgi:hypothetical protein